MLFLLFSLLGFFLLIRWLGRERLHPAFLPAVSVSLISCLVCLGGMIGFLEITERILFGLGIISFAALGFREGWRIAHRQIRDDWRDLAWMTGCFCVLFIGMRLLTKGQFLYSYDDFSHWGLVAKIMSTERRLPTPGDGIGFPSYPLGSTAFLDFCCFMLGAQSDYFLFSQGIMTISFLISLQSCAGKKAAGYIGTTLLAIALMFYENSLSNLSVDNLLGSALMAALLIYLHHQTDRKIILPFLMIILAGMVMIKNSGLPLALILLGILLISLVCERERFGSACFWMLLPLLMYAAWRFHVQSSFTSYGKHQMSLYLYYANLRGNFRSFGEILRIILPRMLSPLQDHALWLIPAFAILYAFLSPKEKGRYRNATWIAASIFFLYQAGILIMYLCSMGIGEVIAQNGNDYPRYNSTVTIGLLGILCHLSGRAISNPTWRNRPAKGRPLLLSFLLGCAALVCGFTSPISLAESRETFPDAYAFSCITEDPDFPSSGGCIVVARDSNEDGYISYMAMYYLHRPGIRIYQDVSAATFDYEEHPEDLFLNLLDGTWMGAGRS